MGKRQWLKYIITFFVLSIILLSCTHNPLTPVKTDNTHAFIFDSLNVDEINELISGNWEWSHSIIMQRGILPPDNLITPEKAGYTKQRSFSTNGIANFYTDNQFDTAVHFEIKKFKILPGDAGYVKEIYIGESVFQLNFSHPDTMMIGKGWLDGIDDYFVRKK